MDQHVFAIPASSSFVNVHSACPDNLSQTFGTATIGPKVLFGRLEEIRLLGRQRRRWEDTIKMDLRKVGYDGRDWINLAQNRERWLAYGPPGSLKAITDVHVPRTGVNASTPHRASAQAPLNPAAPLDTSR
ncbi:hypothetical protein ANN_19631 [Periplaneta americana]|uniref:Uncharacterized protein n=1 Tax=Periplaneta americana TaxID=6978 RepID=A0ABQ8SAF6_PERAM|nr:hypothetical protein ANN_19631 [Periplaneta americana]